MYARLYWMIYKSDPINIFEVTLADWARMKKGMAEIVQQYPHSGYAMNSYAALACMADDTFTYRDVRRRMNNIVVLEAWPSNYSIDLCDSRAKKGQPL